MNLHCVQLRVAAQDSDVKGVEVLVLDGPTVQKGIKVSRRKGK